MSSIVVSGDTSGAITISAPAVAGTNTLSLPALTATLLTNKTTGSVIQVVSNSSTIGTVSTTSTTYVDITNATATITPATSTNKVLVLWSCYGLNTLVAASNVAYAQKLVRTSTDLYTESITAASSAGGLQIQGTFAISWLDSPATTSATTYKIQHKVDNASSTGYANGGFLILMEIVA